jgi:acetyltransferase-like isoleucine patch superfamily enzyme
MKQIVKGIVRKIFLLFALFWIFYYRIISSIFGRLRAFEFITQKLALRPGVRGEYLRYAVMQGILGKIGQDVVISFGTIFSKSTIELGEKVYIGAYCVMGDVRIGDNTLIGDHVCIPSGASQHGFEEKDFLIQDQKGSYSIVHIGKDCWIGSHSVILADIGDRCVIGAGSVITKPVENNLIVAGNPARVIGQR